MEHQVKLAFSHTADYSYIDFALKARWAPFEALADECEHFVPRKVTDFAHERQAELDRLKALNPSAIEKDLLEFIDGQISGRAAPEIQVYLKFADRVMSEYVTVAFLAHALAESAINTWLAVGLAVSDATELFALLERADIKKKWLAGPKAFHPSYDFPKGGALYQTLLHLTRQRNALVHYRIELEFRGRKALEGSRLDRAPLKDQMSWIRRFFSLPYDLVTHARRQIPQLPIMVLHDSSPIPRYAGHSER